MTTGHLPLIIAHRGASGDAPENTLASFALAVEMGCDMVELDVRRTKDGHIVVIHDATLQRTTTGTGFVHEHTLSELRQLDAGSWFSEDFRGERIPTLREALQTVKHRCAVNIEIKTGPSEDPGIVDVLLDELEKVDFPPEHVIVSSFDARVLARLQTFAPFLPRAFLFHRRPQDLGSIDSPILHPHWQVIGPQFMNWVRKAKRQVNVWTVDDPNVWEHMISEGVDGIITNYPARLQAYYEQKGLKKAKPSS